MCSQPRISPGTVRATPSSSTNASRVPERRRRFGALLGCWLAAGSAWAIDRGEPLADALAELERSGLTLIYSSVLVTPDLRVLEVPARGASEDVARRLLAQHGLSLQPVRAGVFAVVRAAPAADEARPPMPAASAPPKEVDAPLEEIAVYASRYRIDPQTMSGTAELSRAD